MKNFAICAIMKDTPDYILKEWINHHFSIGVDDIYIMVDIGSTPLYHDDRVHYILITIELKQEIMKEYSDHIFLCSAYKYIISEIYKKYKWIACIDDDEFMHFDILMLDKYNDYDVVILPWNFKGYFSLFPEKNLTKYNDIIIPLSSRYMCQKTFCKPILNNLKLTDDIIKYNQYGVHSGFKNSAKTAILGYSNDYKYELYVDDGYWCSLNPNIILNPQLNGQYIDHYMFRSFLETVDQFFKRGDMVSYNDEYSYYWGRRLYDYFEYYGITNLYNPIDLYNMLKQVNRIEYTTSIYYPFSIPSDNISKKFSAAIILSKNSDKNVFNDTIKNNIKHGINDIYVIYDIGNEIVLDNLYPDKLHFYLITPEDEKIIKIQSSMGVYNEKGFKLIGVYNWFYQKIRDKYEWILLIDDDEYINTDIRFLWNYENVSCVYIPWKNYILPNNCNEYKNEYLIHKKFYPYTTWFYKSAINTKLVNMICSTHFGDLTGVNLKNERLIINYMFCNSYFVDDIREKVLLDEKSNIFIHHTFYLDFNNLINKIFFRKDLNNFFNDNFFIALKIRLWYKLNNLKYSFTDLIDRLYKLGYNEIAEYMLNNDEMYKKEDIDDVINHQMLECEEWDSEKNKNSIAKYYERIKNYK